MYANQPQYNTLQITGLSLNSCGYEIQNNRVIINISEIANHRELENVSGTLSIELWALNTPYTGADFTGVVLANTRIGELFGQHYLSDCRYDLNFLEPPEGTWFLTLMLREWTETGYASRDYVNFTLPYIVSNKPAITRNDTDNIINVCFSGNKIALTSTVAEKSTIPAVVKVSNAAQDKEQNDAAISLNSASLQDIVSVKGISKKLAENIDAARPFESLDEVLKVKGMGPKLWQKIRNFISL
ncbi:MAG: helix-hairpin-helix domain-containing protein [Methylococcaceae bacterium]|nr:helix-hairpin-helix domain-containing protein [Methylococcaceae bacterium]